MENDKQMNDQNLDEIKKAFLSEELLVKNAKPEVYSLPEEFARSKKNKNFLVFALIILYVATIGVGVYFITTLEAKKSMSIEVNIAEFRQFNLIELLAEKKANEEKLANLQKELEELRAKSLKEIQKLSPKEQKKAMLALNEKMKTLEESYNQQIKDKEGALLALEKTIALEKQRMAVSVQETQAAAKNYQTLNQMQGVELERLKAEYDAKIMKLTLDQQAEIERLMKNNQKVVDSLVLQYNPTFSRGEITAVINSKLGNTANSILNKYSKISAAEDMFSEQDFNQLRKKIQHQRIIIDSLQNIPYTNSVPAALNRLDRLSLSIISEYETLWGNLAERMKEKNDYISSYEYAVNYLSMIRHESGFVIDARNQNRMVIFIDNIYSVKKGDVAYIFKNDDLPIAKIELNPEHGRLTAKVKEILKPIKIEPFDKILLKLGVAQ